MSVEQCPRAFRRKFKTLFAPLEFGNVGAMRAEMLIRAAVGKFFAATSAVFNHDVTFN
ncbi:MAG: hypothetical protein IKP64_04205 [Selenomonadaceae bacterium]|nr:hypothetical protein [Selenomonadaceae bacterium]